MKLVVAVMICLLGVPLLAGANQGEKAQKELTRLQGTWRVHSLKLDGEESKDKRDRETEWVIQGDKVHIKMKGQGESKPQAFRLDATKNPKHFDLESPSGTVKGIYMLQADTLTICFPNPFVTKERPTSFEADRQGKGALLVLKRAKQ